MDRMAGFFGRHRLAVACAVVAMTGICLVGSQRIRFDNNPEELFRSADFDPSQFDPDIARLDRTLLVVIEGDNLMTPEGVETVRKVVRGTSKINGVEAVYSMLSVRDRRRVGRYLLPLFPAVDASPERFERAKQIAKDHPLLVGHFLSEDMNTSLVVLQLADGVLGHRRFLEILQHVRPVLEESVDGSELRARITGGPALEVEIFENMASDITMFTYLGIALGLGIAVVLFGRVGAALLVATGPAIGAIWLIGTLGLIGQPINMLTNVVPLLVVVIGFTDSMHLVLHIRRGLEEGASPVEAAQSAIRKLGLACALTSLSTAVGFGSLTLARLGGIQTFGWCCALGSLLSFCAVMTVVPLIATTPLWRQIVRREPSKQRETLVGRMADGGLSIILRHPRLVCAASLTLTFTLALFALRLEPDHRVATIIPDTSEPYRAMKHLDETFGGIISAYATVTWPKDTTSEKPEADVSEQRAEELYAVLGEVHTVFDTSDVASNPLSLLSVVQSLPGEGTSLAQRAAQLRYIPEEHLTGLVDVGQRRVMVSARLPDVGARRLKPAFADMEQQFEAIAKRHPGFEIELTGSAVYIFRSIHVMIEDLWWSLGTAACVMFVMILIGLRSLRLALVSFIPNIFPLLFTGAFIVLSGRHLEMTSVIVFSISLGIAVDDTIHFLVHFQREMRATPDVRWAIRRTFHIVGVALVMTTLVLVAGHAIVMLSAFPSIRVFGMLTALTIACALVGDMVILPSLLASFNPPKKEDVDGSSL